MRANWRMWGALLSCLLLVMLAGPIERVRAEPPVKKKLVLVVLDGLRLHDLSPETTPHLWKMMRQGGIGAMNGNTLGAKNDVNGYLTLGAGAKASAPFQQVLAYGADEWVREELRPATGRDLYLRNVGLMPGEGVLLPQLPQLLQGADKDASPFTPGKLGSALHALGLRTAVIGNSDLGTNAHRPAVLLAMDEQGEVDEGHLFAGGRSDPTRPYGMRTDMDELFRAYARLRQKADFFVIQPGDLLRLRQGSAWMEEEQALRLFRQEVQEADRLIGLLLPETGPQTLLAVVSPTQPFGVREAALSPVLLAGGGVPPSSVLSSGTTKREGLLANYDLAPTFVQFLGGSGAGFLGRPATAVQVENSYRALAGQVEAMEVASEARRLLVRPWTNIWIGLAVAVLLLRFLQPAWLRFIQPLAEALLLLPLAWLFVPLLRPAGVDDTVFCSFGLTLLIGMTLQWINSPIRRLGWMAALTAGAVAFDLLTGGKLLQASVLSYDPIAGARYYGIGNEYMGVLIGAALLFCNALYSSSTSVRWPLRIPALLLFGGMIYLFAAPKYGTNFGGAMAAVIGCSYAWMKFAGLRLTGRRWLLAGFAAASVFLLVIALNVVLPGSEQTHIGRAATQLLNGQWGELYEIVRRKAELNLLLLRVSAWGKLFLLIGLLLLLFGSRQEGDADSRFLTRNGRMLLVAALAALALNDSGVVAAALILLYALVPLCGMEIKGGGMGILDVEQTYKNRSTR